MTGTGDVRVRSQPTSAQSAAFELEGWPGQTRAARFDADCDLEHSGQAWLPAMLPLLMATGRDAQFEDAMDATALLNAHRIQDLLAGWYPQLTHVTLDAGVATSAVPAAGVGCFFSGGVDSFYSVLARSDQITHLIFVSGFDLDVDSELDGRVRERVRDAAADLGKTLITVTTDVRRLSDPWTEWGRIYHGAALASVGLLLARHVGRVIIPASYHQDALFPWGSHPDLDPLWSTNRVAIEHHGIDRHRTEKVAAIAADPVALRHLRVCWENGDGEYNCGRCEKCVRTMIALRAYGALERCATLPSRIDPAVLNGIRRPTRGIAEHARENLTLLAQQGVDDRELARALRGVVGRERFWRIPREVRTLARRGLHASPVPRRTGD